MLNRFFSMGRIISFFIALFFVALAWGIFFPPGGTGANVILGLALGVLCINYMTKALGDVLDIHWFNRGSQERASLIIQAHKWIQEITADRRKKGKSEAQKLKALELELEEFRQLLSRTEKNCVSDPEIIEQQVASLKEGLSQLQFSYQNLVEKQSAYERWAHIRSFGLVLLLALIVRFIVLVPYQIPSGSMIPTLLVGDHLFVSNLAYGLINPFSWKTSYLVKWRAPQPGEVVVFEAPPQVGQHAGQPWIKRVIATAGQTVKIREGMLYVDNKPCEHVTPHQKVYYLDYFETESGGKWLEQEAIHTKENLNGHIHDIYLRSPHENHILAGDWPFSHRPDMEGLVCHSEGCTVQEGYVFVMGDNRGSSHDGRMWGAFPLENLKGKAWFVWISVDGARHLFKWGHFALPGFRFERWFTFIK